MKFKFFCLVFIMTAVLAAFVPAQESTTGKDQKELVELIRQADEALVKRDDKTLERLWADDYKITLQTFDENSELFSEDGMGRAYLLAAIKSPEGFYTSYKRTITGLFVADGKAIIISDIAFSIKSFNSTLNLAEVWVKTGGQWRSTRAIGKGTLDKTPPKYSMVIFFKTGTTEKQVDKFVEERIFLPKDAKGFSFRKGIYALSRISPFQNHLAVAINISDEADRKAILELIQSSPVIYKVLENVSLNEIKSID